MKVILGFIFGLLTTAVVGWFAMPSMMLVEYESPYDINKTVKTISDNAKANHWVVAGIGKLHKSIKKHGGYEMTPVYLVNLCNATHAYNILKKDENKIISTMMPCTISVYEKSDGKTYIGTMNAGLLGKMFGGDVAQVFGIEVAEDQQKFIDFAKK